LTYEIGVRPRGRPKTTWKDVDDNNLVSALCAASDALSRKKWRKLIRGKQSKS